LNDFSPHEEKQYVVIKHSVRYPSNHIASPIVCTILISNIVRTLTRHSWIITRTY